MTRPDWVSGFRLVSMREFYDAMGVGNVHPSVRGSFTNDDYGSDFIDQRTGKLVGRTLTFGDFREYKPNTDYYLPLTERAA